MNSEGACALWQVAHKRMLKQLCPLQVTVVEGLDPHLLEVTWQKGQHKATLKADLQGMSFEVLATQGETCDDMKTIQYKIGTINCSEPQNGLSGKATDRVQWQRREM